jgi:hypothetical protein
MDMDDQVTQLARQLLDSGLAGLSEREQRVIALIAKRNLAAGHYGHYYFVPSAPASQSTPPG